MSRVPCIAAEEHQLHNEAEGSEGGGGSSLAAPHKEFVHPVPALQRYYAVGMFCVVAALLYADQNLMAPNLTQMAAEFGFNDVVRPLLRQLAGGTCAHDCLPGTSLHVRHFGAVTEEVPYLFGSQEKDQYLGGWIGAAFFLVGAPAAILMGYFSHGYNRCTMFFWVVILGARLCHSTRPNAYDCKMYMPAATVRVPALPAFDKNHRRVCCR